MVHVEKVTTTISRWVTPDGSSANLPATSVSDDGETLPEGYWKTQSADGELVHQLNGKHDANISHLYHRAALVLIPRAWRNQAALVHFSRDELALYVCKRFDSGASDEARVALWRRLFHLRDQFDGGGFAALRRLSFSAIHREKYLQS